MTRPDRPQDLNTLTNDWRPMLSRTLYPYQIEGAKWLAQRRLAAIADDPGLGKTAQALAALDQTTALLSIASEDPLRVLVVTSAVARTAWTRELEYCKSFKDGLARVAVLSWDQLSRMTPAEASGPRQQPHDIIIFDEAHYMKTPDAKRTQTALALAKATLNIFGKRNVGQVWLLSGTLMPNHPGELFVPATLDHVAVTSRPAGSKDYTSVLKDPDLWTKHWCHTRDTAYGLQVVGARKDRLPELRQHMKTFVLRRRKADVLPDLPPLAIHEERLPLGVLAPGAREGMKDASVKIAASILKLDPMLDLSDKSDALDSDAIRKLLEDPQFSTARRLLGTHKANPCADWILEQLQGEPKAVVFAHHTEVLNMLATRLRGELGNNAVEFIDGSTPVAKRGAIVDRFQNDPTLRVLVGQIKAAGTGITLTASKLAVIVEPSSVPSDNIQAFCRVHRIGTKDGARGVFLSIDGTMDANLVAAQYRKARDAAALFD